MVVGGKVVGNKSSGTVGIEVVGHVVTLFHHIGTHLVEGRGGNEVALAVDLPGDRGVRGADVVVTGSTGGGSCVHGNIHTHTHLGFDNHTLHEVGVVVVFIVDNDKHLSVDTDGGSNVLSFKGHEGFHVEVAEDTVIERSLVLVWGSARTCGRVGPVDLIGLSNFHALVAVLPLIRLGEHFLFGVVKVALETLTGLSGELAACVD